MPSPLFYSMHDAPPAHHLSSSGNPLASKPLIEQSLSWRTVQIGISLCISVHKTCFVPHSTLETPAPGNRLSHSRRAQSTYPGLCLQSTVPTYSTKVLYALYIRTCSHLCRERGLINIQSHPQIYSQSLDVFEEASNIHDSCKGSDERA